MAGTAPEGERFLVVATIRRPHGVKGELSVTLENSGALRLKWKVTQPDGVSNV